MPGEIIKQRIYLRIGLGKKGLVVDANVKQVNDPLWSSTSVSTREALPTIQIPIELEVPKERLDLALPQATEINLKLKEDRAINASIKAL